MTVSAQDDDGELVERCRAGDERAFEELVRKYQQTVFNVVYHHTGKRADAEDIAQKVFSKVYFSLPKFERGRPFLPWLYRIAINQCYDELRRARRRRWLTFTELSLEEGEAVERLVSQNDPREPTSEEWQELHGLLLEMLDRLPKQQKAAIVLRDLEDVPYGEIAGILECSEQAARLKVFRGRARLKDLMQKALRRRERMTVR